MALERGEGHGGARPQVPELDDGVLVVATCGDEVKALVRVPRDVRNAAARGVTEFAPKSANDTVKKVDLNKQLIR